MKLFNVPLQERQASLLHAYREHCQLRTINVALQDIVSTLEQVPEISKLADARDKQRNK